MSDSDHETLTALRLACAREVGGWASAHGVSVALGRRGAASSLGKLVREGKVEMWMPNQGRARDRILRLYRVRAASDESQRGMED